MGIFHHKRKNIAVIGGGTGSYTVLKGLKDYDVNLSAIVNVTDDGGSSGILRDEFGVLPPGDVRRCIAALSDSTELMKQLFQYRFPQGSVNNHSLGNLLITALKEVTGSDEKAIEEACKIFNVKGSVLPVTLSHSKLCAELENGEIVKGETNIDVPKHDGNLRIRRVYLEPFANAYKGAVQAIHDADLVVIGPGDLYGSVIANLLVKGIPETMRHSCGRRVYVCNLMTKFGETNGFKVHNFVREIERYIGSGMLDYIVYNNTSCMDAKLLERYAAEKSVPVNVDETELDQFAAKKIAGDYAKLPVLARHDSKKIAKTLVELL